MNTTIVELNKLIVRNNNDRGIRPPWTASLVHHSRGHNKRTHRYGFLTAGCHPGDELGHIADQLVKVLDTPEKE